MSEPYRLERGTGYLAAQMPSRDGRYSPLGERPYASTKKLTSGWLTVRALINPTAAEGRIRYSAMYRYRSSAAQALERLDRP
jgi:hypothetical protein